MPRSMLVFFFAAAAAHWGMSGATTDPEKPALTLDMGGYQANEDDKLHVASWDASVKAVDYSPDGKLIVAASVGIKIFDARTGAEVRVIDDLPKASSLGGVSFSSDGKHIAAVAGTTLTVREVATGRRVHDCPGHAQAIQSVAWSPDGKTVVTGSGYASNEPQPNVKVWDASTGKELLTLAGLSGEAFCVAFSPDGKTIAAGSRNFAEQAEEPRGIKGEVRFWDAATGRETARIKGLGQGVNTIAFTPDGKRIAVGSTPSVEKAQIALYDVATGKLAVEFKGGKGDLAANRARVYKLAIRPDGKRVAAAFLRLGGDGPDVKPDEVAAITIWDAETGKLLSTIRQYGVSLAYSPDGKRLVVGSSSFNNANANKALVWDLAD